MNIKQTVSLSVLFASALLLGDLCYGQSNVVYYGAHSNAIHVSFVDTSLSMSAQASIVADLQICLNEWGKKTYLSLELGADEPGLIGYLQRPSISPHYPENIEFPDGVTNTPSGPALQIPKALSDAYTNAFAFAAANSNIVAAAYEFAAYLSSTNFYTITSNEIVNVVLVKNATPNMYLLSFADTTNSLRKQTYYPPSVLSFNYSPNGPAVSNLWMEIPCSNPAPWGGGVTWNAFPAIWHDNKWKIGIWNNWGR